MRTLRVAFALAALAAALLPTGALAQEEEEPAPPPDLPPGCELITREEAQDIGIIVEPDIEEVLFCGDAIEDDGDYSEDFYAWYEARNCEPTDDLEDCELPDETTTTSTSSTTTTTTLPLAEPTADCYTVACRREAYLLGEEGATVTTTTVVATEGATTTTEATAALPRSDNTRDVSEIDQSIDLEAVQVEAPDTCGGFFSCVGIGFYAALAGMVATGAFFFWRFRTSR